MTQFETRRPAPPQHRTLSSLASATLSSFLVFLISSPLLARAEGEVARQPALTVEERVHETGEVARDRVVEHTFKLRNSGDAPLTIDRVVRAPNLEIVSRPASLAPGESGEIRVRVPLLYERPVALLKQVAVHTNDPRTPTLMLELKILSTEYVIPKPGYARWNSVVQERPGTISQKFIASDGQNFDVLRTTTPPTGISSSLVVSQSEPGKPKEWKLDLTLATDAPVGPIVGTLLVYVNHPKQSIVPIPLSGFQRPVMAVTPNTLSISEITLIQKRSQEFTVQSFSTEPIHVTRVEHDLKGFPPATFSIQKVGREYKIKLTFDPATAPKGALRGTLSIFTDSAKVPVLKVPIDGTIR